MSARWLRLPALAALAAALLGSVSAQAGPSGRAAEAAPQVETMVVGASGQIIASPRFVSVVASSVRVAHKSCAVGAGTPLAALIALQRAHGPSFSLRDYGRCGVSARDSGQLFVYQLAGESNRGQSGWEYKVDGVSGSAGAADPSGPRGDGRLLRSGAKLLWFWCAASGGGCQRSLETTPSTTVVRRGASLSVLVSGRDNNGRAVAIGGAIVKLDTDFASTGSGGRASLIAPRTAGRYVLSATRRGLVPSFPETIVVR